MTARYRTLLSETIRCACQQKRAALFALLLSLVNYSCYTRGTWVAPVPVYGSVKIFFSSLLLQNLLNTLLVTIPWLLLTQATRCQGSISLLPLIKSSLRVFPKLLAVRVSLWLLLTILGLISVAMVAIVLFPLLGGTWLFSATSKSTSGVSTTLELLMRIQPPHGHFWSSATLLIPMLPVWYFCCRFLFAFFSVIADPKAGVQAALRHSWQLSAPCTTHLFGVSFLMGLLFFLPAWGLQMSALHTNPWANIGITLYISAIGLFAWIYLLILYQHQTVQASLPPP